MKHDRTLNPFPTSSEEIEAAIARAPTQVVDPDCPYDRMSPLQSKPSGRRLPFVVPASAARA